MTRKFLIPVFPAAFVLLAMLTGCYYPNPLSKSTERIFEASYEGVTNTLSALKPSPTVHVHINGSCEFQLREPRQDPEGIPISIINVTIIDSKRTRVQIRTIETETFFFQRTLPGS